MNTKKKGVTIASIANATGLSPSTISRAINHRQLVNDETYDKIFSAMKELGYSMPQESPITTQLQEKRILVVNVADVSNSFYKKIFRGINIAANNYGWYVMINQDPINSSTYEHFLKILTNCNAIGLITFGLVERGILNSLLDILPVVQCCEFNQSARAPYISVDDFAAAVSLMEYLITNDHKRIAILNGPMNLKSERERQRGYEFALEQHKMEINPEFVISIAQSDYFMAHTSMSRLFKEEIIPDAVFAVSDVLAYATIVAAKENHLSVPGDLSVIGYDNINLSEMSIPKITTINLPCFKIGFLAGELIHDQWRDRSTLPKSLLLDTELILRDSTRTR